ALDIAMSGSYNTILHTLDIAREAEIPFSLAEINAISDRTPHLCKVAPSGVHHMEDIARAGGISAILSRLAEKPGWLHLDAPTVSGRTLGETVAGAHVLDPAVIRPLDNPYSTRGGLDRKSTRLNSSHVKIS